MRRALFLITAVLGVVSLPASAGAAAVGTGGPVLQAQAKPKPVCTITDPRLVELSGLVATKNGYVVINDGSEVDERRKIFYLNRDCAVTNAVDYSGAGPYDTEDLALSPDRKTLWIADTGDNITSAQRRERVALWSMPVAGNKPPSLHRLAYPEKTPHDAEALLIADDGTPIIITKSLSGSKIFVPEGPLQTDNESPVPMKEVGRLTLPRTTTENLLGTSGRVLVTGAARSPDGTKVVVRTYADAFEFDVPDGDVVKALTEGKPRATALTDPFGEAITYTADGKWFLTVSEIADVASATELQILRYQPSDKLATEAPDPAGGAPGSEESFFQSLSLQQITYLIAAVGVIGVLLVGAGVTGILRARRKPAAKGAADEVDGERGGRRRRGAATGSDSDEPGGPGEPKAAASARAGVAVNGAAAAGVYGGAARDDDAPRGGDARRGGAVYGGAAPAGGGGVYGGGVRAAGPGGGGGVYGGGAAPAAPGGARGSRGGVYGGGGPESVSGGGGYGRGPARGGYGGPPPSERGGRPGGPGVYGGRSGDVPDENEARGRRQGGHAQEPPVRGRRRHADDPGYGEPGYDGRRPGYDGQQPGYNRQRSDERGYGDAGYDDRHRGGGYR